MKKLFFLFSIITIVFSCSSKLAPDSTWKQQRWVLTDMKGVPVQLGGGNRDAYIEFFPDEDRFAGNGGCNRISGNYKLEKDEIKFSDVLSTKMACADINFETTFLATLNSINHYSVEDNSIFLKDGTKVVLTLTIKSK